MHEIAISKFKATCLGVIEEVRKTRTPVRVTRFGRPVAEIVPVSASPKASWLGSMRDQMKTTGDIVAPIHAFGRWTGRSR
ncbi:MAG TPA: type II toxin-antitoxin system prevent-host-death family antitoxin [Bryobacteraceae bacterium]|nr:type II toxin-antitoxin system prevent-host-death family antitoxin [Bryobacteraceae bacterium]